MTIKIHDGRLDPHAVQLFAGLRRNRLVMYASEGLQLEVGGNEVKECFCLRRSGASLADCRQPHLTPLLHSRVVGKVQLVSFEESNFHLQEWLALGGVVDRAQIFLLDGEWI